MQPIYLQVFFLSAIYIQMAENEGEDSVSDKRSKDLTLYTFQNHKKHKKMVDCELLL